MSKRKHGHSLRQLYPFLDLLPLGFALTGSLPIFYMICGPIIIIHCLKMLVPMVIAAVMLGKSFDLDNMYPGNHVFKEEEIEYHKMIIESPFTRSEYRLVESSSDVSNFLNLDGELSLKAKGGKFQIDGTGDYLTSTIDRSKTVELLISVYTEQFVETFPTYIRQEDDWESGDPETIGTHFVRSMVYGAQLLISYKMQVENSVDLEEIKGAFKANIETSGSLNADVKGKLEKISKAVSGKYNLRIHTYATCSPSVFVPPMDLEGVFKLTDEFPSLVANFTDPIPVRIELESLSALSPDFSSFKRNVYTEIINDAINRYDDIRTAMALRDGWDRPDDMSDELLERLADFEDNVSNANDAMLKAIRSLNSSASFDVHHFDEAFAAYAWGNYSYPNRFTREFNRIKNDANKYTPLWYSYTRAVNEYTHWGQITCSMPSPDPIHIGLAVSSTKGFGNGADLLCTAADPMLTPISMTAGMRQSVLNGLTFQDPDGATDQLVCARCLLENATSITTVPAKKHCPEGTKLEYQGFLATGFDAVTDPVCIDIAPLTNLPGTKTGHDSTANVLRPLWIKCPECENPDSYVPCVVCSR